MFNLFYFNKLVCVLLLCFFCERGNSADEETRHTDADGTPSLRSFPSESANGSNVEDVDHGMVTNSFILTVGQPEERFASVVPRASESELSEAAFPNGRMQGRDYHAHQLSSDGRVVESAAVFSCVDQQGSGVFHEDPEERHPSFELGSDLPPQHQHSANGNDGSVMHSILSTQGDTLDTGGTHNSRGGFGRRQSFQHVDEEAGDIPDMSKCNPNACVRWFKRGVVGAADVASISCKIIGGLCGISLFVAVGDYTAGGSFLTADTQAQVALLSTVGVAVFSKLDSLLQKVKLRDELHLIGYVRRDEFNEARAEQYPDVIYSQEEIIEYLRQNNGFVTLPRLSGYFFRSFLFNSMCILESVLGVMWAITGGLAGVTTTSGMVGKDLIGLNDMAKYRELTLIFSSSTAVIVLVDKNRLRLKKYCEDWIYNYQMLMRYFVYIAMIPEDSIYEHTRPVPHDFIGSDLHNAMQSAATLTGNDAV